MLTLIPIQEISTLAILIPLILTGIKLKTGDRKIRLFFAFIVFGAFVDGLGWFLYLNDFSFYIHSIFQFFYLWFEAVFFVWLAFEFLEVKLKSHWRTGVLSALSTLFLVEGFLRFVVEYNSGVLTGVVFSVFLIVSSFLTAFALLRMAEAREDLMKEPWFWILSGIFFYCFGCFFVDLLSYTEFGPQIWGLRNVVNILQYVFFVVGLVKMN